MSIASGPHVELRSSELAAWIEKQGLNRWWNVDGDHVLTSTIAFPCPGDELANELRRINRPLLLPVSPQAALPPGSEIKRQDIDKFIDHLGSAIHHTNERRPAWLNNRLLYLSWKGSKSDWLLVEDVETTEMYKEDQQKTLALQEG